MDTSLSKTETFPPNLNAIAPAANRTPSSSNCCFSNIHAYIIKMHLKINSLFPNRNNIP